MAQQNLQRVQSEMQSHGPTSDLCKIEAIDRVAYALRTQEAFYREKTGIQ